MKFIRNIQASAGKLRGISTLVVAFGLAFAVMSQPASADTLHGYCGTGPTTTCLDNNTNSPTSTNPPVFTFVGSGGGVSGDLVLDFLIPNNVTQPTSVGVTGTASGTATLFSSTAWTSGQLDSYLGISASPTNPIGAFGAGSGTGYYVYQVDLGQETLAGTSSPFSGISETTTDSLPVDTYIVAFLDTATVGTPADWSATANSGAILETGTPTTPTPEPSSLALLGTGALGLAGIVRRKFRRA